MLWKLTLKKFFQIFLLSITSFVALLLVMRLQEIARFATLTSEPKKVFLFALLQVPYILPLAIPISSLIASYLVIYGFSTTHELTALRVSGISLPKILSPLLISSLFLTLAGGLIASELTPRSRFLSKDLAYATTISNPLLLIQKEKLMKQKESYVEMKNIDRGSKAEDLIFVMENENSDRLTLIAAEKIKLNDELLVGTNVTILSTLPSSEEEKFDSLIIENQQKMVTSKEALSSLLQGTHWIPKAEFLPFKWMVLQSREARLKPHKTQRRFYVECARRLSLALCTFTFTFIGATFGLEIGRRRKKKGLLFAIAAAGFVLLSFSSAKSFHKSAMKASLCYLLPHPLVIAIGTHYLTRRIKGIE